MAFDFKNFKQKYKSFLYKESQIEQEKCIEKISSTLVLIAISTLLALCTSEVLFLGLALFCPKMCNTVKKIKIIYNKNLKLAL